MEYNQIKDYLEKFKQIIFSKEEEINIISKTIENIISIKIEKRCFKIKNQVIYIKTSPLILGEILMKKKIILSELKQNNLNIIDIK